MSVVKITEARVDGSTRVDVRVNNYRFSLVLDEETGGVDILSAPDPWPVDIAQLEDITAVLTAVADRMRRAAPAGGAD